jgi:hypothetical protein
MVHILAITFNKVEFIPFLQASKKKSSTRRSSTFENTSEASFVIESLEPMEPAMFRGPDKGVFQTSSFWTIPSSSAVPGEGEGHSHWAPTR